MKKVLLNDLILVVAVASIFTFMDTNNGGVSFNIILFGKNFLVATIGIVIFNLIVEVLRRIKDKRNQK